MIEIIAVPILTKFCIHVTVSCKLGLLRFPTFGITYFGALLPSVNIFRSVGITDADV
jgi:hypothetical protein